MCLQQTKPDTDWLLATTIIGSEIVPLIGRVIHSSHDCHDSGASNVAFKLSLDTVQAMRDIHQAACYGFGCTLSRTIDYNLQEFIFYTWCPAIDINNEELTLGEPEFARIAVLATMNMVSGSELSGPSWQRRQLRWELRKRIGRWIRTTPFSSQRTACG